MSEETNGNQNHFADWQRRIPTDIAYFKSLLPPAIHDKLNYSSASLDILETWLFEQYSDDEGMFSDLDKQRVNGLVFYVGEVFRKHFGGQWRIDPEDMKYAIFFAEGLFVEFENGNTGDYYELLLEILHGRDDTRTLSAIFDAMKKHRT